MDLMFEDDTDEVGSDVEAYCPKCKADTTHVVISKYEDEIRRVQCNPCGDVHAYRKPRGEVEDDVPEPIAAKKRAQLKKLTYEEFFAKHDNKPAKPYEFRELYKENVIVTHPKFGKGFVSEVVSDSKVEITFKDARRILVHNRKDVSGVPLAAVGDGTPTPPPAKNKDAAGAKAQKDAHKDHGKDAAHDAGAKAAAKGKEAAGKVAPAPAAKKEAAKTEEPSSKKAEAKTAPEKKPAPKAPDKTPDKKAGKAESKSDAKSGDKKSAPKASEKKPAPKAAAKKPAAKGKKK